MEFTKLLTPCQGFLIGKKIFLSGSPSVLHPIWYGYQRKNAIWLDLKGL